MLGIELLGAAKERLQGWYFCPFCGGVFVRFPGETHGLVAKPMPALQAAPEEADPHAVEAFVFVSAAGGISFGRRRSAGDSIEWSGEMMRSELQPPGVLEYSPELVIQIDKLEAPARASINWAGDLPPASVKHDRLLHNFNATWSVYEWS
jgi:hypothetical protein